MGHHRINGRVLIIAGSDSGGGAGIQADIKTVTALGSYAATAVTAVTDQNTVGVHGVHNIPPDFVASQIKTVLTDIGADVIKTGMLASVDVVNAVADACATYGPRIPRVIDPVMVATGGHRLIADGAVSTMAKRLIRGAAVVTPNLPEAEVLTGLRIRTLADMDAAIDALRELSADAVLLKGGHVEGNQITDLLITKDVVERFEGPRLETKSTHGTGCTLASAVAAGLTQGLGLSAAVMTAREFVRDAILTAPGFGRGHGPLNHVHAIAGTSK